MHFPKGRFPSLFGLVCAAMVVLAVLYVPGHLADRRAERFAEPFYNHLLPEGARLLQTSAAENDENGVTTTSATILLQSEWDQAALFDFYNDTTYPPARENNQVTLSVLPLDENSLQAVQQAGLYEEEGGSYWFIYLYSAPPRAAHTSAE